MWIANDQRIPVPVLESFSPMFQELHWVPVSGGFSGAAVWRGDDANGMPKVALKRWPAETTVERLTEIHRWMSEAAYLPFVPSIISNVRGDSVTQDESDVWDATKWLAGKACQTACKAEVESACEAVAKLHNAWAAHAERSISPNLQRRIDLLSQWLSNPEIHVPDVRDNLAQLLQRALQVIERTAPRALEALRPWSKSLQLLQPCIRDLRGDHVLFQNAIVTGIVDYGALAIDTPAFDLARLLGDLIDDDAELFVHGMNKYRALRPSFDCSDRFVLVLARVGVIGSLIGWFARFAKGTSIKSSELVAERLLHLIVRAELCKSF